MTLAEFNLRNDERRNAWRFDGFIKRADGAVVPYSGSCVTPETADELERKIRAKEGDRLIELKIHHAPSDTKLLVLP